MSEISVIVPVYKVEPYLRRCLDSILEQSFSDFELILVDDGSPDSCGIICDAYAEKDSRIHVIHQQNQGLSGARNTGIDWAMAHSKSRWIAFVDSDDWVHPDYLRYLYNAANETGLPLAGCDYREVKYGADVAPEEEPFALSVKRPEDVYIYEDRIGIWCYVWRYLIHKDLMGDIRFLEGKSWEDMFFTPRILFQREQLAYVDAKLYMYCLRPHSIVSSRWTKSKLHAVEGLEFNMAFLADNPHQKLQQQLKCGYLSCLSWNFAGMICSNTPISEKRRISKMLYEKFRSVPHARKICRSMPADVRRGMFPLLHPGIFAVPVIFTAVRDNLSDRIRNLYAKLKK